MKQALFLNGDNSDYHSLDEADVRLIRALYRERITLLEQASHLSIRALANKFGVSHNAIHQVINYITWKDVTDDTN